MKTLNLANLRDIKEVWGNGEEELEEKLHGLGGNEEVTLMGV